MDDVEVKASVRYEVLIVYSAFTKEPWVKLLQNVPPTEFINWKTKPCFDNVQSSGAGKCQWSKTITFQFRKAQKEDIHFLN